MPHRPAYSPLWPLCIAAAAAALFFALTSALTHEGLVGTLDARFAAWMAEHRDPSLESVVRGFTSLGLAGVLGPLAACCAGAMAWARRSFAPILTVAAAIATATGASTALKRLFDRPRPPYELAIPPFEHTASFPSGHTLNAAIIAGVLAWTMGRRWAYAAAVIFAASMGASRVWLGHHWLSDVCASWCLGILIVAVLERFARLRARRNLAGHTG